MEEKMIDILFIMALMHNLGLLVAKNKPYSRFSGVYFNLWNIFNQYYFWEKWPDIIRINRRTIFAMNNMLLFERVSMDKYLFPFQFVEICMQFSSTYEYTKIRREIFKMCIGAVYYSTNTIIRILNCSTFYSYSEQMESLSRFTKKFSYLPGDKLCNLLRLAHS